MSVNAFVAGLALVFGVVISLDGGVDEALFTSNDDSSIELTVAGTHFDRRRTGLKPIDRLKEIH